MGTICIHHHEYDTLAAELIGGALLSVARIRLQCYAPSLFGLPPAHTRRADRHLIVWTVSAQQHDVMRAVARLLDAHDETYLLLRRRDAPVPASAGIDNQWPIFEKGCDWNEYRGMLRKRIGLAPEDVEDPPSLLEAAASMLPQNATLQAMALPLLGTGLLLWALLR